MSRMFNIPRGALITILFLGAMSIPVSAAHATDPCPDGTVAITNATRAAAKAAGIPDSSQCWPPSDPNVGQAAGETKEWLKQNATKNSNISCMNADFAKKLKAFMEAAPKGSNGKPPVITDGYRDPGKQAALVASGASRAGYCQSYHNYGLAADFNNNTRQQTAWMRANARGFGIGTIGAWDPNHFQNGNGRYGPCGQCANAGGEGSYPAVKVSDRPDDVPASPQQSSPLAPLTNAIRNLLNPQPQQQPAQQPATTTPQTPPPLETVNSTPYPAGTCATQYHCVSTAIYYRAGTCVDSVYQQCPYGCANSQACATATSTATTTSDTTNTPTVTPNPELDRLLENLGQATTTTGPVGTAVIVVSPGSLRELGTQAGVIAPSVSPQLPEMTPVVVLEQEPVPATQTFSPTPTYETGTSQRSVFSAALGDMQIALQRLLIFLQPFRGRYPGGVY